jgi:hypothetical protein
VIVVLHCDGRCGVVQGVNTEKYVPNPKHTSPQALAMFEFVGRLMGIVLRHKNYLPFELPPLVRIVLLWISVVVPISPSYLSVAHAAGVEAACGAARAAVGPHSARHGRRDVSGARARLRAGRRGGGRGLLHGSRVPRRAALLHDKCQRRQVRFGTAKCAAARANCFRGACACACAVPWSSCLAARTDA